MEVGSGTSVSMQFHFPGVKVDMIRDGAGVLTEDSEPVISFCPPVHLWPNSPHLCRSCSLFRWESVTRVRRV